MLEQYIVLGLAQGSLYALMALGMVLIFKTTDVVNFGQADMTMFSAYVGFTLLVELGWPFWAALPVVIAFGFLLGVAVERLALRPAKDAPVVSLLIVTLGVALMLNAIASWIWGFDPKSLPYAISGPPLVLGNIIITRHDLVIFVTTIALSLGFFALLKFTKIGTAMRAVAQNRLGAQLLGIPVYRIQMLSWGLGVALGAVAGVLIAPLVFLDLVVMIFVMLKGFAAAVLGGFTSLPGAIVGGLLIGLFESLLIAVPFELVNQLKETLVFLLIIVLLAVRPQGLLGKVAHRRI